MNYWVVGKVMTFCNEKLRKNTSGLFQQPNIWWTLEFKTIPKSLTTCETSVSSLASTEYLMIGEMQAQSKGFATLRAFVRFLSRMNSLVKPEVWPFSKGLATFNICVWLSSSIYFLMKLRCEHLLKVLPYSLPCKVSCQYGLLMLT